MKVRHLLSALALAGLVVLCAGGAAAAPAGMALLVPAFVPLVAVAPDDAVPVPSAQAACTTPAPTTTYAFFHCYRPSDILAAYGVDRLHTEGLMGQGQTIVIVDSYGSPTASDDLRMFSQTFGLPTPDLHIIYPNGRPSYSPSMQGVQASWAFETSLDLQWAHVIAPEAKLVLLATNPAETEGVQGFPSMFAAEQYAVEHYPGSVISQSFAATEQAFQAAAPEQVARFDEVYRQAVANRVTVIGASGDSGTANVDKQGRLYPYPTVNWPSSDPLVTSAGGTWLQYGWRWNPGISTSAYYACLAAGNSFDACAALYLASTSGSGRTEAVWKEDWLPAAGGGGLSALFATPPFQSALPSRLLNGHRGIPDLAWNAAVDGGVLVYTSFPGVRVGWHIVGGTSAAAPQLAGLIALANQLADQSGKRHVGYLNPLVYRLSASDFNDITPEAFGTGAGATTLNSNALAGSGVPGMLTTEGWDLTTGFGSPRASSFVHDLVALLPAG
ncbi:MAG: S53 family peptidase [Chloroflexi bacterium]|nr:S53 family peptidase [Chloroflexota bacterium]